MMELKQNIFELIGYQVIKVCFAVLQIAILADIFVFSDSTVFNTKQTFLLPNRILLLLSFGLCILAIIISFIKNKPLRYEPKKVSFFLLIASILLFIIQLTISLNTYFFPVGMQVGLDLQFSKSLMGRTIFGTTIQDFPDKSILLLLWFVL